MTELDVSMRVLMVDDHKEMRDLAKYALKRLGFDNVDDADDGVAALIMLSKHKYGLVLSDLQMTPMDGMELLKEMRSKDETKDTPFVMLTGDNMSSTVQAALSAGANHYMVKPLNPVALKKTLNKVFGIEE